MKESKVLLKDLPFGDVKRGTVITHQNNNFIIEHGSIWHDGQSWGSHAGHTLFSLGSECDILASIWNNKDWFNTTKTPKIKYSRSECSITLHFSPQNLHEVESITQGIRQTLLKHYKNTVIDMGWKDEKINITF